MSSGPFSSTFYQTNSGEICNISVQPETLSAAFGGAANDAGIGPATQLASAIARKSSRETGVGARSVTVRFDTPPTDYSGLSLTIPVLRAAVFDGLSLGDPVTYLGATGEISSLNPESIK